MVSAQTVTFHTVGVFIMTEWETDPVGPAAHAWVGFMALLLTPLWAPLMLADFLFGGGRLSDPGKGTGADWGGETAHYGDID